jgi:cytochrome c-type biogenesis protein CcmH
MIVFWMVAAGLSAIAAALMLAGARKGERRALAGEDPSIEVHRRQLAEIDDLVGRGLLSEGERQEARAEAGRRLLTAADRGAEISGPGGRRIALLAASAAPIVALGLYLAVGSPGLPDAPFTARVAGWRASDPSTLTAAQIAAVLSELSKTRPNDAELLRNLALARQGSGDLYGASSALRRAVAVKPDDPALWTALGETFMALSDGQVGADARQAFGRALQLDPRAEVPRYSLAMADIGEGRVAQGLAGWKSLLAGLSRDDPRRAGLAADIAVVERTGALPKAGGPASAVGEAPGVVPEMQDAIKGMVAGLAARLEANPEDVDGWARLIRAYTVLGNIPKRDEALARARKQFEDRPDQLKRLNSASEAPQ